MADLLSDLPMANSNASKRKPVDLFAELKEHEAKEPREIQSLTPQQEQRAEFIQREGGLAGLGAEALRGLLSQRAQQQHPVLAPFTRGLGQGLINPTLGALQLAGADVRQVNLPGTNTTAGDIGKFVGAVGGVAPYYEAGGAAVESLPMVSRLGGLLPYLKSGIGGAAAMMAQQPQTPARSALIGGGAGVALSAVAPIMRSMFGTKAPERMSKRFLDQISGGLHSSSYAPIVYGA